MVLEAGEPRTPVAAGPVTAGAATEPTNGHVGWEKTPKLAPYILSK